MATFAKQSVRKISINYNRPKGRFLIGVNMTKQEIIKRFESFGFKLGLDQGLVFGFIKRNTTSMCSMMGGKYNNILII